MNKISKFVYGLLYLIFPSIRKERKSVISYDKIEEIGRNELCYCGSNEKYKKCHYTKNDTDHQIAIKLFLKGKFVGTKVLPKTEYNHLKGIKNLEINVQNTFSEIEVGLGGNMD